MTGKSFKSAKTVREKLFWIVTPKADDSGIEKFYNYSMIFVIFASIIPLCFKETAPLLIAIDRVSVTVFIIDYAIRWITADFLDESKNRIIAFVTYPFSFMAIVDLLSIIPSIGVINEGFKLFRMIRLLRAIRVVRIFKTFRYSKNIERIAKVIGNEKDNLFTVLVFALAYIFVTAIIGFQVEPNTFDSFFDALYWSTISLTTVGYGDIYAVSTFGRLITMISSLVGISVVALPAGIITAGYMKEIEDETKKNH